ncbi:hypothetical protein DPMN_165600 [Dreissena polymorpha]|uniref:Uncharacterized protein n=1 Tax=Dreissena polymorpha TaxID=45954 RepID=A0A9D4ITE5_DREPO|nr:hypothetical protein DPMN_165600 [Dreissena polymorpha]
MAWNATVGQALADFVVCVRLEALAVGETECTTREILSVMSNDPYHIDLIAKGENLTTCLPGT